MRKEDEIMRLMKVLKIADKHTIGRIMSQRGHWAEGTSATNNAYKILCSLADLNQLEKGKGYFRIPGCKSEYQQHARLVTLVIIEILLRYPDSLIHREHSIPEVGLRPDILALLIRKGQEGRCLVTEIVNHELDQSLEKKRNAWESWSGATEYLSQLFGYRIPFFDFIALEEETSWLEDMPFTL